MTASNPSRRSSSSSSRSSTARRDANGLSTSEYVTLAVLIAGALIATAMLVSWLADRQNLLAPESPSSTAATDGPGTEHPDN